MCIIRGKHGYFVLYVVKNWLLCSIFCQKLAKYVLFVKVYCRRLVMVDGGKSRQWGKIKGGVKIKVR